MKKGDVKHLSLDEGKYFFNNYCTTLKRGNSWTWGLQSFLNPKKTLIFQFIIMLNLPIKGVFLRNADLPKSHREVLIDLIWLSLKFKVS